MKIPMPCFYSFLSLHDYITFCIINHREKNFFLVLPKFGSMCVCSYVCLCDYSHTVQPRAFKFWHNIPYVNI